MLLLATVQDTIFDQTKLSLVHISSKLYCYWPSVPVAWFGVKKILIETLPPDPLYREQTWKKWWEGACINRSESILHAPLHCFCNDDVGWTWDPFQRTEPDLDKNETEASTLHPVALPYNRMLLPGIRNICCLGIACSAWLIDAFKLYNEVLNNVYLSFILWCNCRCALL